MSGILLPCRKWEDSVHCRPGCFRCYHKLTDIQSKAAMSYSPYLPRTPHTTRSSNGSTPTTPRLGYRGHTDKPSPRHHYVEMLVQASDNQSDTCSSTALYSSPAHQRLATYGTLQTDISKTSSSVSTKQHILIADSATPSDDEISYEQTVVLNRPIAWIWMVMNLVVFALCLFSILQPYWLVNREKDASLGVLNHCVKVTNSGTETDECFYFNTQQRSARLLTLASLPWKIGLILCLISCILLAISSVLAALCLCISVMSIKNKLSLFAGYQQLIAGKCVASNHPADNDN